MVSEIQKVSADLEVQKKDIPVPAQIQDNKPKSVDSVFSDIKKLDKSIEGGENNIFARAEDQKAYLEASAADDPQKKKDFIKNLLIDDLIGGKKIDGNVDGKIDGQDIFNVKDKNALQNILSSMMETLGMKKPEDIANSLLPELSKQAQSRKSLSLPEMRSLTSSFANNNFRNSKFPGISGSQASSVANLQTPKFSGDTEQLIQDTVALFKDRIGNLVQKGVIKDEQEFVNLVKAMMKQESGGNQNAVSNKGATGLMQLMPETARGLGVNPNDPADNLKGGVAYILQQLETFGNIPEALAAYNAGPGNVKNGKWQGFKETTGYVRNITAMADKLNNQRA